MRRRKVQASRKEETMEEQAEEENEGKRKEQRSRKRRQKSSFNLIGQAELKNCWGACAAAVRPWTTDR